MKKRAYVYVCLLCLALVAFAPHSGMAAEATTEREVPVMLDKSLQEFGLKVTTARILASEAEAAKHQATIFLTCTKPFYGELFLKGFRKDGTEVARSAFLIVNQGADKGGHVRFSFDKDTKLNAVESFTVTGEKKPGPPPREESWGEKATNIVKELFE